MKTLSREDIIRMKDNRASGSSSSSSGGSFDPYAMGLATQMWVQSNYVSIEFFKKIFKALNGSTEILPNDTDSTITSIKAMYGFWTEQYVSALGQSAGGGGGGATALTDLVDVNPLMQPTAGQVLTYNATLGKWTAMDPQGGGADMQTVWAALAASTSEQINASHLSTALSGYATQSWVGQQGYLTSSAISDMATQTWVNQQGFVKGHPASFWGQAWNGSNTAITGSLTNVQDILPESSGSYSLGTTGKTFKRLYLGTNSGNDVYLEYDSSNHAVHVVNAGLYADTFVSALGASSGGGGSATALTDLVDVNPLMQPTAGQVLTYSNGKWTAMDPQGGGGTDMQTVWAALASSTSEQINASHLSTALSGYGTVTSVGASDGLVTNQTAGAPITSSGVISLNSETRQAISHGETAYGWGNHANKYLLLTGGTLTGTTTFNNACWTIAANENNEISSKHWGNSSLYNNANTAVLASLAAIRNALRFRWYNTYWNIGNIRNSSDGTYGFGIALEDTTNDRLIDCFHVDSSGTINSLLYFDTTNNRIGVKASSPTQELDVNGSAIVTNLFIRSGLRLYEWSTYIWEIGYEAGSNNGCFNFYRYNSSTYAGNTWMAINPSNGYIGIGGTINPQANIDIPSSGSIKIGGGVIKWDSTHNSLYVESSNGSAANFYATGGVSALGFSAGTSSVDAMTFGYLTVNNMQYIKANNYTHRLYGNSNGMLVIDGSEGILFNNDIHSNENDIYTDGGNIRTAGGRLYLDTNRYIYVSSGTLYYYNGSQLKQIAFTN